MSTPEINPGLSGLELASQCVAAMGWSYKDYAWWDKQGSWRGCLDEPGETMEDMVEHLFSETGIMLSLVNTKDDVVHSWLMTGLTQKVIQHMKLFSVLF